MYGVCRLTPELGHRAVRVPCGQVSDVLHACCVVVALARSAAPAPLRCPTVNCRAQHPRRDMLEPAVQTDPGLLNRARRVGGGIIGDEDLRSQGLWCG